MSCPATVPVPATVAAECGVEEEEVAPRLVSQESVRVNVSQEPGINTERGTPEDIGDHVGESNGGEGGTEAAESNGEGEEIKLLSQQIKIGVEQAEEGGSISPEEELHEEMRREGAVVWEEETLVRLEENLKREREADEEEKKSLGTWKVTSSEEEEWLYNPMRGMVESCTHITQASIGDGRGTPFVCSGELYPEDANRAGQLWKRM